MGGGGLFTSDMSVDIQFSGGMTFGPTLATYGNSTYLDLKLKNEKSFSILQ